MWKQNVRQKADWSDLLDNQMWNKYVRTKDLFYWSDLKNTKTPHPLIVYRSQEVFESQWVWM